MTETLHLTDRQKTHIDDEMSTAIEKMQNTHDELRSGALNNFRRIFQPKAFNLEQPIADLESLKDETLAGKLSQEDFSKKALALLEPLEKLNVPEIKAMAEQMKSGTINDGVTQILNSAELTQQEKVREEASSATTEISPTPTQKFADNPRNQAGYNSEVGISKQ